MRNTLTILVLALCLSVGFASIQIREGSTIFDNLKTGHDAVYHFKETTTFEPPRRRIDWRKTEFDMHIRESSYNGNGKRFVVILKNVDLQGADAEELDQNDMKALSLPIVVVVKNEGMKLDKIYAKYPDTDRSIKVKYNALDSILHNMTTPLLRPDHSLSVPSENTLFGLCNTQISKSEVDDQYLIDVSFQRDQCTGRIDDVMRQSFSSYGITDVKGNSRVTSSFYFDKTTKHFARCTVTISGTSTASVKFFKSKEVQFEFFKKIRGDPANEAQNTKVYTLQDCEDL